MAVLRTTTTVILTRVILQPSLSLSLSVARATGGDSVGFTRILPRRGISGGSLRCCAGGEKVSSRLSQMNQLLKEAEERAFFEDEGPTPKITIGPYISFHSFMEFLFWKSCKRGLSLCILIPTLWRWKFCEFQSRKPIQYVLSVVIDEIFRYLQTIFFPSSNICLNNVLFTLHFQRLWVSHYIFQFFLLTVLLAIL